MLLLLYQLEENKMNDKNKNHGVINKSTIIALPIVSLIVLLILIYSLL